MTRPAHERSCRCSGEQERADQEAKVNSLRREAKLVKQELPVPRYSGTQKIIDAEGAPLMPAMEPASPAPPVPAAGSSVREHHV